MCSFLRGQFPVWLNWHQEHLSDQCWVTLQSQEKGTEVTSFVTFMVQTVIIAVFTHKFSKTRTFPLDILNSPQNKTHAFNLAHRCSCSVQCPEGGAVLREALLCPAETEGDISSQPEHGTHSGGGAVSVPTGGSAAGAQKVPQCQRYVLLLLS